MDSGNKDFVDTCYDCACDRPYPNRGDDFCEACRRYHTLPEQASHEAERDSLDGVPAAFAEAEKPTRTSRSTRAAFSRSKQDTMADSEEIQVVVSTGGLRTIIDALKKMCRDADIVVDISRSVGARRAARVQSDECRALIDDLEYHL